MEKEAESRRKKEVLEKVGQVIASIKDAKHVDQVICALHSLALRLFPLDSHSLEGIVNEQYGEQLTSARLPDTHERDEWWRIFYKGPAFATLAKILLYDVAYDWLACLPISARMHVYDVFFLRGQAIKVVQKLVPCLQWRGSTDSDTRSVHSNAERLLVLCLLDNMGATQIARELSTYCEEDLPHEEIKQIISRVVQLLTSIPDKAQAGTPKALSSHVFFRHITAQLLAGAHEWDKLLDGADHDDKNKLGGIMLLMGAAFARISRRGSADVLLSVVVPEIHKRVQSFLLQNSDIPIGEAFQSTPGLRFWLKMMESINDSYSLERMTEQLLKQLAARNTGDIAAHWILWILFHQVYQKQASIRSMFLEKFLLWKVFPSNCLRWILHFAVFQCSPENSSSVKACNLRILSETLQRLVTAWSKREFLQSTSIEQQAYITAALGLCLEKMCKEDLDATKDAMHCILEGVSCRLESADHLIRKMASCVALAFSKVIDPQNPLYLDDSCREEAIDWDFGLLTPEKRSLDRPTNIDGDKGSSTKVAAKVVLNTISASSTHDNVKSKKKKPFGFESVDPDEIIDAASLNNEDNASETSESSNDSSLQPYDLKDDDADLKRNFSQLVDVIGALRKSDDPDGVDKAIDVAEKLVRASPDELKFVASDLARGLVQVRCSESTIEGEEESAEEKRQKAIVALIVTCPHESLSALNKLLYSPNLDVSQRLLILDVMTEAAQELANTRISRVRQRKALVSSMGDEAWFMPKPIGSPGASPWKEISTPGTPFNWSHSYERELPSKSSQIKRGKTRRWSLHSAQPVNQLEWSQNKFPQYAAAFMLPSMAEFDKKRQGVDLLGRDFIVLGKFIYMLGVCMKCSAMHPEASVLASPLLELLRSREISHHKEAYVRRSVLFTASCILVSLHPSSVAAALVEENSEISRGLEWVRSWALDISESDTDRECYTLAMTCLQLHAEMALQASRALESQESLHGSSKNSLPSNGLKGIIKIPSSSGGFLSAS
ncbi:telomere length regulation protein TEL2 [Capsicum chacoense]